MPSGSDSMGLFAPAGTRRAGVHPRALLYLLTTVAPCYWDLLLAGLAGEPVWVIQMMNYEQWWAMRFTPMPSVTSYLVHPKSKKKNVH